MPREAQELSTAAQEYDVNGFINEIRGHVETWRAHRPENGHWQRQDDRHGDADRLANVNAVRTPGSNLYSRGFLEVAPGITIKDRLRVLQPNDPDSCFRGRELVPADMLPEIGKAKIVITNFHTFKLSSPTCRAARR